MLLLAVAVESKGVCISVIQDEKHDINISLTIEFIK